MNKSLEIKPTCDMQNTLPKLRTYFCQLLEELKIRRENDVENDRRVEELVSIQHGLEERLEEGTFKIQRLQDEHISKLEEQRKMFEDQIKDSEEEKMKAQLLSDTSLKEIKSLRDEIRKLHVSKFSLEKIIKDQECKLQLMNTSRDSYQLQISQIETQSTRCTHQLSELEEALSLLQDSVKSAESVNDTVRTQNTSYSRQLDKMRELSNQLLDKMYKNPLYQLTQAREEKEQVETVKLRVQLNFAKERMCELENELTSVKSNLSKSTKSLQDCHQLISDQTAGANKRMEEEVKTRQDEKIRLEGELDNLRHRIIQLEEKRGKLLQNMASPLEMNKNEDVYIPDSEPSVVMESEMMGSPVILCPPSQEALEIENKVDSEKVGYEQCSQECEEINEREVSTHILITDEYPNSSIDESAEPSNKRVKLEMKSPRIVLQQLPY